MKYGELTLGQIEALVNKLGGMEGVKRFLAGELVVKAVEFVIKVFMTIKLSTGFKSADDFRQALKASGMKLSDWASDILGKPAFKTAGQETELDIVVLSVAELGFKDGATREKIYERAQELGLQLCPPEVGPQLRLQYQDQPEGEWIFIGMEPLRYSDGYLYVLDVVRNDSELWLGARYGDPGNFWRGVRRWAFVRPRK